MLKRPLSIGIGLMMLLTLLTYANHFDNAFHFDDFHTIVNNANIRTLKNTTRFFDDGSTSSVLPQNQAYRPVTVLSLAIDYAIAGDYYHSFFQTDTFILFLLQGLLMVCLFKKLFDLASPGEANGWIAVVITTLYMLNPANAETVNYIIARTDVQSTLFVVLGLVLYSYSPFWRKTYLYLLPIGIGILCKTTAVMFAPILFFYVLFFERQPGLKETLSSQYIKSTFGAIVKTLPALIFCGFMFWVTEKMTPKTWIPGGNHPLQYLITQPFVVLHYFGEFFLPTGLSADTDWTLLPSVWDVRFFAGCAFIIIMLALAVYTSRRKETRPVSFGIIWFFLALLPTSSIIPLAEVLNDHRMYFPFVGLALSVGWSVALLWANYRRQINNNLACAFIAIIFALCVFGTYKRNEVWHDEHSLWYDVTQKSPGNARGLMNYGLALYDQADYKGAEHYLKAAEKLTPSYSVIYTNLGLIKQQEGDMAMAENYYKAGIKLGDKTPDPFCYYAGFLSRQWRFSEAEPLLLKAIKLSPLYLTPHMQLMGLYSMTGDWDKLAQTAQQAQQIFPQDLAVRNYVTAAREKKNELDVEFDNIRQNPVAQSYVDLSSTNYQVMRYRQCIAVAAAALKLSPDNADAYNNIGVAYRKLGDYGKAEEALKKALALRPGHGFAQNNLAAVARDLNNPQSNTTEPLAEGYINLSLYYFNNGRYNDCIKSCDSALLLKPLYDLAYNNMCAAYNKLAQYKDAIAAAQKALQINPNNEFLKNNLAEAIKAKQGVTGQ